MKKRMRFEEWNEEAENRGIYNHNHKKCKQSQRSYEHIKGIEIMWQIKSSHKIKKRTLRRSTKGDEEVCLKKMEQGVRKRSAKGNETVKKAWFFEGLTYKWSASGIIFQPLMMATCTFVMEYSETSPQNIVCVASLKRHVGLHGRAISLFTNTSSSSSLRGLCTGPER